MFELYNTDSKCYVMIYGVSKNFQGEPIFLVYVDNEWVWTHSDHFQPFHT